MKKHSGSTLLAVLTLLVILSAFILGALGYTMSVSKNVERTNALRAATEIGDGALEYAFANWRAISRVKPTLLIPNTTTSIASPGAIPLPTAAMFPSVPNFTASTGPNPASGTRYTIANFGVQAVTPQIVPMVGATTPPTAAGGMNYLTNSYYYLATATVTMPGFAGRPVTVNVNRVFQKQQQSPWNYAIFFNDLLEVNPGANMTITGWVHTNNYLYTDYSDLTFNSRVDFVDDWVDGTAWAPGDLDHSGIATAAPSYSAGDPPVRGPSQEVFGIDVNTINAQNGTSQTASQVYSQVLAPGATNADFGTSSYYNQADIRILVSGSTVTMYDSTNTKITASSTGNDLALYKAFTAAITTPVASGSTYTAATSIQDSREGTTVPVTQLNMSTITSALTAKGGTNTGTYAGTLTSAGLKGIIYISDSGSTATAPRGIQLTNGATMPVGGLTVASNNGVYIQGDYNTGQTSSLKTPTNTNNNGTGSNIVSGYDAAGSLTPSAVVGDAVMILSNNWSNTNSSASLSTSSASGASSTARNATPTTINAAIVSGNIPTGTYTGGNSANTYSGGAENFPRFLENWTGIEFTYYGSMVELFQSQQFTAPWGSSNVYNAPSRNWNFDPTFFTNPPPGNFVVYSFTQQRWYVQ
jgi:hypothetical protein